MLADEAEVAQVEAARVEVLDERKDGVVGQVGVGVVQIAAEV